MVHRLPELMDATLTWKFYFIFLMDEWMDGKWIHVINIRGVG